MLTPNSLCTADIALASKLQEELQYEQTQLAEAGDATPEFIKTFTEEGVWAVRARISCSSLALWLTAL